ncbi:hypothetical protein ICN18_09465 [Polynucleobacter sp. Ross1-W9]|uniref:hypothetical protein n=1 Tax=Polynucleobacter parvulilacunae TaxID=1855631 RepID=UPI001C0AEE42|nr:hypothetical protein [Polynucleobacter parvulilacunae]MBU3557855.1 hypothetical protein [Polynucleobacter parvulilacunae]
MPKSIHKTMFKTRPAFWKIISYGFVLFALLFIFSMYFAPDMMVAVTNQVWALCGW